MNICASGSAPRLRGLFPAFVLSLFFIVCAAVPAFSAQKSAQPQPRATEGNAAADTDTGRQMAARAAIKAEATPVAVSHEGTDTLGAKLSYQLKEVFNSGTLFALNDKDEPKLQIIISTVTEFPSRPGVGSVYSVVWLYTERSTVLSNYLAHETGAFSADTLQELPTGLPNAPAGLSPNIPIFSENSGRTFLMSIMDIADPQCIGIAPLLFLIAAAFFAGLLDSMAGGGGLISLPATLVVGIPPHLALGTGKFMAAIGTTASFITYARGEVMAWKIVAVGVGFSFFGSMAGAKTALYLDNAVLGKVILFLLPVAAALTFVPVRGMGGNTEPGKVALYVATPLICTLIGFYDGFFGPGTGSFLLLSLHFFLGLNLIAASATTKAFNLASNISGLAVFFLNGKIYYYAAVPMALANMAGNILGSRLALKRGPALIRRMLLISLALLFATLIWRYS